MVFLHFLNSFVVILSLSSHTSLCFLSAAVLLSHCGQFVVVFFLFVVASCLFHVVSLHVVSVVHVRCIAVSRYVSFCGYSAPFDS